MVVLFLVRSLFLEIVNVFLNSVIDTYLNWDVTLVLTTPIQLPPPFRPTTASPTLQDFCDVFALNDCEAARPVRSLC